MGLSHASPMPSSPTAARGFVGLRALFMFPDADAPFSHLAFPAFFFLRGSSAIMFLVLLMAFDFRGISRPGHGEASPMAGVQHNRGRQFNLAAGQSLNQVRPPGYFYY